MVCGVLRGVSVCAGDAFKQAKEALSRGSNPWDHAVAAAARQLLTEWQQDLED